MGLVLGHEICGVIDELGKAVEGSTSLRVGDVVIVYPWKGCRQCEACTAGNCNICENNLGGTTDMGTYYVRQVCWNSLWSHQTYAKQGRCGYSVFQYKCLA